MQVRLEEQSASKTQIQINFAKPLELNNNKKKHNKLST